MELIKLMAGATLMMVVLAILLISLGAYQAGAAVLYAVAIGWVAAIVAVTLARKF